MLNDLLIWGALLVGLIFFVVDKRRRLGALTLAYFLGLSLGHVPGILAYLNPEYPVDAEPTEIGFNATLIGMMAFIGGAIAARILRGRTTNLKAHQQAVDLDLFSQRGWQLLVLGAVCYFFVLPVSALVPSLTAITSALGTLLILGFWLQLFAAVSTKDIGKSLLIVAMMPLLPLATLTTGGFIGFGTVWALSVMAFLFVIMRRRIWFYLASPFVIFVGLSLFVTYYQQRAEIRDVVWYHDSSIVQRLDQISKVITKFQLLDLSNEAHLAALDERLNQNFIVGEAIMRYQDGEAQLMYGATLPLWALIPRAIWPDKPAVGGGQNLVSQFTGIRFEEGTSVGAGQVFEFYANFAMPGVLAGFAIFGFVIMRIDQALMRALVMRDIERVLRLGLPGLALLQPLNNLLEIVVAVTSAIITSQILVRLKIFGSPTSQRPNAKMSGRTMPVIGRR